MNQKRKISNDHILVFLLVALSTIPFFKSSIGMYLTIFSIIFFYKKFEWNKKIIYFLVVFFVFELYHFIYFEKYDFWVIRQVMIFFLIAAYIIQHSKVKFLSIFIDILYIITIISLFIFGLNWLFPSAIEHILTLVPGIFKLTNSNIYDGTVVVEINPIFYNFGFSFRRGRNSGPFWEATVFASMMLIAQIFNILINRTPFNKKGNIFSIGIISTFSTTVYLDYFLLIGFYFLIEYKTTVVNKLFIVIFLCLCSLAVFEKMPFLKEKIQAEISNREEIIDKFGGDSRIASFILDISEITQNTQDFLLGRGTDKKYRIQALNKNVLRNCGLSAFLVEWGIGLFLLYISLIFYSFRKLCSFFHISYFYSVVFTIVILITTFSEVFLDTPLYHIFPIIGFLVPSKNSRYLNNRIRNVNIISLKNRKSKENMLPNLSFD